MTDQEVMRRCIERHSSEEGFSVKHKDLYLRAFTIARVAGMLTESFGGHEDSTYKKSLTMQEALKAVEIAYNHQR